MDYGLWPLILKELKSSKSTETDLMDPCCWIQAQRSGLGGPLFGGRCRRKPTQTALATERIHMKNQHTEACTAFLSVGQYNIFGKTFSMFVCAFLFSILTAAYSDEI